jgi:hypothetical protein
MATNTTTVEEPDELNGQTTLPTYAQFAAERAGLAIDRTRDCDDTATDRRVERALNEDLYAEQSGASEWIVHSGSGSRYLVDMLYPSNPQCSCEDSAQYCKHVLRIFLFGNPAFLTDEIYGVGEPIPSTATHITIKPGDDQ